MAAELLLNPFPVYAQMRQYSPVLFQPDQGVWLIYRYQDVKAILNDHTHFSNRPVMEMPAERSLAESINTMDPPRHTQLRALVSKAFSPKAIADMEEQITQVAHELLDQVIESGEMDLIADFAVPLPVRVIADMMAIPYARREEFKQWSQHLVESVESLVNGDFSPKPEIEASMAAMNAYFAQLAKERAERPGPDLVSRLATAEVDGERLSDQEVIASCILLMVAGNETTTNLLGNGMLSLLEHPDQLALLRLNPALMPSAVEEMLRFRSPSQAILRACAADAEIGGYTIKAGQRVLAFVGSANRDESVFADPDRLDITRNPNPHIAFGHGIHFCLGAVLARLEGRIGFTALLERLQNVQRADSAPLTPIPSTLVHGVRSLKLRFTPGSRRLS